MAQSYDFSCVQGDTHSFVMEWRDPTNTPINLSGYTAKLQVKADYTTTALVTLTESSGMVIDGTNGKVTITFTAAQTGGLAVSSYLYDLQLTSPGNVVTTLIEGRFTVQPQVTI